MPPLRRSRETAALLLLSVACSCSASSSGSGDVFEAGGTAGVLVGGAGFAGKASAWLPLGGTGGSGPIDPEQITAAEWDDNQHFLTFGQYAAGVDPALAAATPLTSHDRVVIRVTAAEGKPVAGALVNVATAGTSHLTAPTGSDGRLLFFPSHDGVPTNTSDVTVTVHIDPTLEQSESFVRPLSEKLWDIRLTSMTGSAPQALDLALVLDATANMDTVLAYVANRLTMITAADTLVSNSIDAKFAAVLYRDEGDDYVTKSYDFSSDLSALSRSLRLETAAGGGDHPEAIEPALENLLALSWRAGVVAKLAFVVFDAPPHPEQYSALFDHVDAARRAGIRLYPIATRSAADVDYLARVTAQWTLARFVFTTRDNGLGAGGVSVVERVPCYQVFNLDTLLESITRTEIGLAAALEPYQIIRGVPAAGAACMEL
jgi:hypothetical protein